MQLHSETARQIITRRDDERAIIAAIAVGDTTVAEVTERLGVPWRDAFVDSECVADFGKAVTGDPLSAPTDVAPTEDLSTALASLRDAALRRRAYIELGGIGDELNSDRGIDSLIERFTTSAFTLRQVASPANPLTSADALLSDAIAEIQRRVEHRERTGDSVFGVPSGLPTLDRTTSGFMPGTLTVLLAAPGTGKTTLCNQMGYHAAQVGAWTLYVTFENSVRDLITKHLVRLGNGIAGTTLDEVRHGNANVAVFDGLQRRFTRETAGRLFIVAGYETTTIETLRLQAERLRRQFPNQQGLLIIDYVQKLAETTGEDEVRLAVSSVSSALRNLAVQLAIAVLAISSVNRAGYQVVTLASGKESGSLEFDADVMLGLMPDAKAGLSTGNKAISCQVLKNRAGPVDTIMLLADWQRNRFSEQAMPSRQPPSGRRAGTR